MKRLPERRYWIAWALLGPFAVCSPIAGATIVDQAQLLASRDDINRGRRVAPYPIPEEVELYLQYDDEGPPPMIAEIGRGILWRDGQVGVVDLSSNNDAKCNLFAARISDGLDNTLKMVANGIAVGGLESDAWWGLRNPDLHGYKLDFVRLDVRHVATEALAGGDPGIYGFTWEVDFAFEFWGHAVPEPSALLLWLPTLLVMGRRRSFT